MRFLLLTMLSVLVVSCNNSGSSRHGPNPSNPGTTVREEKPVVIQDFTEVKEVDLLDVAMDVPVQISGNTIMFQKAAINSANGLRTACNMNVAAGEVYNFRVDASTLTITNSAGQRMDLTRVSGSGDGIVGSWTGKTYEGDQMILKRMTFVSENRLVMRTHCEG